MKETICTQCSQSFECNRDVLCKVKVNTECICGSCYKEKYAYSDNEVDECLLSEDELIVWLMLNNL